MKSTGILLGAVGMVMTLTGCATGRIGTGEVQARALGKEMSVSHNMGKKEGPGESIPIVVPENMSLKNALALALTRNPQLKAYSYEIRAAEARALQAGLFPNPELEAEMEEFDRDGQGTSSAEMVIGLGQLVELGGKRKWRKRVALIEGELAAWDYEEQRLSVFAETATRFTHALAAERRLELAESAVELAKSSMKTVEARVEAGKEPQFQMSKASAEFEMRQLEVLEAGKNAAVSRKRLAAMWGEENTSFKSIEGSIDTLLFDIPSINAARAYLSQNPQLARRDTELRLRKAALASAKATRIPDIEAAVGFQQFEEDGTDALAFRVGLPLPLFDRNQGGIAAAKHDIAKAEMETKAVRTALSAELAEAHTGLTTAHSKVKTFREKVLPASEQAFSASREAYEQGKFGYLAVLDAQRSLFDVRLQVLDALIDYHTARITLEQLTGTPLKTMQNTKGEK